MTNIEAIVYILASMKVTLIVGFVLTVSLLVREWQGKQSSLISAARLSTAVVTGMGAYAVGIVVFGYVAAGIPISHLVEQGIGQERMAFVLFAVMLDMIARFFQKIG